MLQFWLELFKRAGAELLSARGTTLLDGVVIPVIYFVFHTAVRFVRHPQEKRKTELKDDIINGLVVTSLIWLVLISYYLFLGIPGEIRIEALRAHKLHFPAPPRDRLWDKEYTAEKEHLQAERSAARLGWITRDREEHITNTLLSNSANRCQLWYYEVGNINPHQIELLKKAVKDAHWPELRLAGAVGTESIMAMEDNGPKYIHHDVLSVAEPDSGNECAKAVSMALSLSRPTPQGDISVPQALRGFSGVVIVLRRPE